MAKLTPNQQGALDGLKKLIHTSGADAASVPEWKRAAPDATISVKSLVKCGAVKEIKVARGGPKPSVFYAPV